jgi:hypothetical protein
LALSRYKDTKIVKSDKGEKLNTTNYKSIPHRNDDIYLMSTEGDRFDVLAQKYYGDSQLWWYIAKANNLSFNNVPRGVTIRIPSNVNVE